MRTPALPLAVMCALLGAACELNLQYDERSFPQPIEVIDVAGDSSEIELVLAPTPDGAVLVERTMRWNSGTPRGDWFTSASTLRLASDCDAVTEVCDASYLITTPLPVILRTRVDSGHGHVTVTGARGLEVARGDGRVEMSAVSGAIDIVTGSGAVVGAALRASSCAIRTGSGAVGLAFTRAPDSVRIETESGAVSVLVPPGSYRLALASERGAIETEGVEHEPRALAEIAITTDRGDIEVHGVDLSN